MQPLSDPVRQRLGTNPGQQKLRNPVGAPKHSEHTEKRKVGLFTVGFTVIIQQTQTEVQPRLLQPMISHKQNVFSTEEVSLTKGKERKEKEVNSLLL